MMAMKEDYKFFDKTSVAARAGIGAKSLPN